jgi:hypothetical protein
LFSKQKKGLDFANPLSHKTNFLFVVQLD